MTDDLGTVAGLAAATTVIVGILKPFLRVSGRYTQLLALVVAVTLSAAWNARILNCGAWEALLRGVLSGIAAVGIHQGTVGLKTEGTK